MLAVVRVADLSAFVLDDAVGLLAAFGLALAGEHLAEINLLPIEADAATGAVGPCA